MRFMSFAATVFLLLTVIRPGIADESAKPDATKPAETAKVETTEVTLKDMVLNIPSTWKAEANASSMRLATYSIPAVEGDKEPGELSVFNFGGGGGSVSDNLGRWIGQFSSEGRTVKVTKGQAGDNEYYTADIAGSYNRPVGPPVLRKTELAENYRMLAVILVLEGKGVYYLKLAGPDATIKAEAKSFRASFGGDIKSEKEFEI